MTDERGGRYFREARFFLAGDKVVAQSHILEARSLMGYMRDMRSLGGPAIQVRYATLQDGTQIKATMMNGQYQAQIFSPSRVIEAGGDAYEIWVRPDWSVVAFTAYKPYPVGSYDWLVSHAPDCAVTTTRDEPRLYSNRMWQAPDRSIYCIVGGYDKSKYTGAAGTLISRDGVAVASGTGIVGVGVFRGQLVMVTHVLTTTIILGIKRDQVVYTVSVGGVEKLVTPMIDAYLHAGYGSGMNLANTSVNEYRFSQNIVVFNADASEGSCVLGNAKRLIFSLTSDEFGAVVVSHSLEAIPGSDYTYVNINGAVQSNVRTCVSNYPNNSSYTINYSYVGYAGTEYTVALLCDYRVDGAGVESIVYLLMECVDTLGSSRVTLGTDTQITAVKTGGITVTTGHASDFTKSEARADFTLKLSTGELIHRFGLWNESLSDNKSESSSYVNSYTVGNSTTTVVAADLKHGFVLVADNNTFHHFTRNETWIGLTGQVPSTVVTTTLTYPVLTPVVENYVTGFAGALKQFTYGDIPSTVTETTLTAHDGLTNAVIACSDTGQLTNVSASSDTRTYSAPARTDSRQRPKDLLMYEDPLVTDRTLSCGFVAPSGGAWDKALVFLRVNSAPAEAYSICKAGGVADVTAQFTDAALLDGEPITQHFGVIHKTTSGK